MDRRHSKGGRCLRAFFADDFDAVIEQARKSSEPTHMHPEGAAGAIAVALAAAYAARICTGELERSGTALLRFVAMRTPPGDTHAVLVRASELPFSQGVESAVGALGNGHRVISSDTVPFALWCAARHLDSFEEAWWTTVSGLGDRDTTCAIAGGVVALAVGAKGIPARFLAAREPLLWPIPINERP